ncbi:MAG: MFS transporter [Alphaproteobacteria bacterium]|nr:MFS transporter [Alphaproteobacteria bacterium]
MKKKSSLRRFLTNVYAFAFFNKLMLLSPVYAVFMQEHGVSDMALSVLFIILSVGTFMTQIPVTWITNRLGQKNAMILGQVLKAIAFVLWLLWPTFWGFAIGMFLWGVQTAFINVAFEAMIYDELRARRHHDIYARVLGGRYNVQAAAAALSAFGSLLMFAGYGWITLASIVALGLSVLYLSRIDLRSGRVVGRRRVRKNNFIKLFRAGVHICMRTPCIFLMLVLTLLVSNICYLDDYLSPIGLEIGLPVAFVGIVQFFLLGCSVLGQTFAYRFQKIPDWILYLAICIAGGSYVLFSVFYSVAGLGWLGIAYVLFAGIFVLLYARFQDFLPQSYRSVILSLYSIGDNVIYVGTCLLIGLGGTLGSWRYSVLILGAILVGIGIWALLGIGDRCSIRNNPNAAALRPTRPIGDDIV